MKSLTIILGVLLVAGAASADSEAWISHCNESGTVNDHNLQATPVITTLAPGERACAESVTQTNETSILHVGRCSQVDIFQYIDADGDGIDSTVTGQVQICPGNNDNDDSCDDFGLAAFTAADVFLQGLGATYIRIASGGTTDADQVRWEVRCEGNASNN